MTRAAAACALVCHGFGPLDELRFEQIPVVEPAPGEVQVGVACAGLNFPDVLLVKGSYQERPALPFIPGGELSGTVKAVGLGVDRTLLGARVMAMTFRGALSEYVNLRAKQVRRVPVGMSMETAAGFQGVFCTAYYSLRTRAHLKAGDVLLVLGSAGGVGSAAVQIGAALGAKVIAAAGSANKVAFALAQGAHHGIDYSRESLRDRARELTDGRGVDVVVDPVGGAPFDQAVRAVAWNGRYVVIGFASGKIGSLPANLPLLKGYSLIGAYYGRFREMEPDAADAVSQQVERLFEAGLLRPRVERVYPFRSCVEALQHLERGDARGKLVVAMTP